MTDYFRIARTLVRGADERPKPNAERLREFHEAKLPGSPSRSSAPPPSTTSSRSSSSPGRSPSCARTSAPTTRSRRRCSARSRRPSWRGGSSRARSSRDVAVRKQLWEGGKAAVDASQDPMIAFARAVDPDARAVRKMYEDEIESVVKKGSETIAQARFAVEGTPSYPDATFTLRLSYGTVKGWTEGKKVVPPFTTLGGAFERDTGREPFALPRSWLEAKPRLDLETQFNFVATTDIIGGNSGSPVVDRDGQMVGLVFDGNIWSLGGDYGFDEKVNRTVAVDTAAITAGARRRSTAPADRSRSCARAAAGRPLRRPRRPPGPVPEEPGLLACALRRQASRGTAIIRSSARRAPGGHVGRHRRSRACPRRSASRTMTRSIIFMYGQCMRQPRQPSAITNSLSG